MLLDTYNPVAKAKCPTCEEVVDCYTTGGNLAFAPRYLDFYHEICETHWRRNIDNETTKLLPEPR
ncbi:hypothetical protein LCGC14_2278400 [marine sediment metagenome]|uniref:Uncharacterized protein n=1 Tax=marine sediment metagenome TaxID=412755 RepID=A0A0F9F7A5_9ZZZZ